MKVLIYGVNRQEIDSRGWKKITASFLPAKTRQMSNLSFCLVLKEAYKLYYNSKKQRKEFEIL